MSNLFNCSGNSRKIIIDGNDVENDLDIEKVDNRDRYNCYLKNLPYYFRNGSAVVLDGEIHILGGIYYDSSNVGWLNHYKYNLKTNLWTSVSTLPYQFNTGSAVVLDGEIHILGASYPSGAIKHYKYNPTTNKWTSVSTLPYEFKNGSAVVLNGEIHILGGEYTKQYHYKYNPETGVYSNVSVIPYEFYKGSAVVLDGEIHILGGVSSTTSHSKWTGTEWVDMPALDIQFYRGEAVVLDGCICLVGNYYGMDTSDMGYMSQRIFKINPDTNEFTLIVQGTYHLYDFSAVVLNGRIHALQSEYSYGSFSNMHWLVSEYIYYSNKG